MGTSAVKCAMPLTKHSMRLNHPAILSHIVNVTCVGRQTSVDHIGVVRATTHSMSGVYLPSDGYTNGQCFQSFAHRLVHRAGQPSWGHYTDIVVRSRFFVYRVGEWKNWRICVGKDMSCVLSREKLFARHRFSVGICVGFIKKSLYLV